MHTCQVCDKSYRSRGSLNRHIRNHSIGSSNHICPECDVAFSRGDLLRRHFQIHKNSENLPISPRSRDQLARFSTRQRCHTACQPCREARKKCNGEFPCSQCISSGTECEFRARAHRVSRIVEVEPAADPEINPGNEEPTGEQIDDTDRALPDSHTVTAMYDDPKMPQSPVSNFRSPIMESFSQAEPLSNLDHMAMSEMDLSWANTLPCVTGSWPWLHEDLFLQGDTMLNCVEELTSSDLSQFGFIQQSGLNANLDEPTPHIATSSGPFIEKPSGFETPNTASLQPPNYISSQQAGETTSDARAHRLEKCDSRSPTVQEEELVGELVTHSVNLATTPGSKLSQSFYWQHMSIRIAETFRLESWPSGDSKLFFFNMMELYKENFSPLWPLLSGKDFCVDQLHPLLFLTIVSIGCMYGSTRECKFGNVLHERIRKNLAESLIGLENSDNDLLWLGQARLLSQVAALYFGQRRGFSYAQHLNAILIAQARRMDLFSAPGSMCTANASPEQEMALWHTGESRKRLAFGILRADVFASVLLNTKPMLSAEEISLDLPSNDELWQSFDKIPQHQALAQLRVEISGTLGLPFCDLVRVAEDREEALLNMNARGYELLIFGLQDRVWRFSHDRSMFARLTGQPENTTRPVNTVSSSFAGERLSISSTSQSDQLGVTFREMIDLRDDCRRITQTLQKWEQSFAAIRTTPRFSRDRSSVMSSMLLLHISYLRLCAPLTDLHFAAYAIMDKKSFDQEKRTALLEWARGPEAIKAVGHVQQIWSLLLHEINRSGPDKAKYNLLAFSGLHHAVVIIWAFAGVRQEQEADSLEMPGHNGSEPIPLIRENNHILLKSVVNLYKQLIPRGWISFAAAAEKLAGHSFPVC